MKNKVCFSVLCYGSLGLAACEPPQKNRCGPSEGIVERVVDGDTVVLASGERIRYLMVDTPETFGTTECYGPEAKAFNKELLEGKKVSLKYDVECKDRYDRYLAYVYLGDREVNTLLLERGFACVLHIPPNGVNRNSEFKALERKSKALGKGLWGACESNPC